MSFEEWLVWLGAVVVVLAVVWMVADVWRERRERKNGRK
jgi:NADH:ubiquinone oxidoreductase subunit 6 (subunit J)